MAEGDQGEKTEDASAKRLSEARENGQLPRSQELTNLATMIGGSGVLVVLGESIAGRLAEIMRHGLQVDPTSLAEPGAMGAYLSQVSVGSILMLLPIFGALVVLVLAATLAIGGWNFSLMALSPNFSRMNPLEGFGRLFGLRGFAELGKAILKCLVIGGVCAMVASHMFNDVLALAHMNPRTAIGRSARLLSWAAVWLSSSLLLVAAVDVPLQIFQFNRQMRMSRQELRDESKDAEGRPEVKRKIRQMQQQVARRRMMTKVPGADVVIVNPTHFAVALKYDPDKMRAPLVLAKGVDLVALNIRRIAEENRVPIFEAPKLARALHRSTDLGKEIPAGLYMAVAQVLSYVFRVRMLPATAAARVARPDPKVGDEYEES
jgi:flagellar biosynthetic protein FlhB